MVLESILNPFGLQRHPLAVYLIGFFYATLALFLSVWVFREYASMLAVFFTVMAAIPFVFSVLKDEEYKDIMLEQETSLLKEHSKALAMLMLLFLGFLSAFTLWYVALPGEMVNDLYLSQTKTISSINSKISGQSTGSFPIFARIFFNNVKVLTFAILFAFLYGIGALFILTWNASVLGAALGTFIKDKVGGAAAFGSYFHATSWGILRYFIHGIPEMVAYFIGGLAGGIISVAIIRRHFRTRHFEKIIFDSSELIIIALLILAGAALLEVYVTPLFY